MGLFKALLDALLGEVDAYGGKSLTKLTTELSETNISAVNVESNLRFGVETDGTTQAVLLINGEMILSQSRPNYTQFTTLTRGYQTTRIKTHPIGSLVIDMSANRTALDHVRRGFFTRTARLDDLDAIGRNHGLHKCPGLTEEQWRDIVEVMSYLPNQPIDAFERVLDIYPGVGNYEIIEDLVTDSSVVTVKVVLLIGDERRGRFFLNGGHEDLVDGGGLTVTLPFVPTSVQGVFVADDVTRNGKRNGVTNYYASLAGSVITLTGPLAPGLAVLVDASVYTGHYLALDETQKYPTDGDYYPYLADPTAIASCLLDQVRKAGARINFVTVLA